ncbi:MAG: DnaJ domain-containing protein [Acidobacteriota bacterium]|jgi:curved DNA-binding protein CbpA
MNPFQILGVAPSAGDTEIRQAYLEAVREAPPDVNPERFAALSRAYEMIKDERTRLRYILFHKECPGDSPLDALVHRARLQGPPRPLGLDAMKEFLKKCADQ